MQWDAFNRSGSAHSHGADYGFIGQDYAFGEIDDEAGCIWISDGCSASPNVDVGARLLAHTYHRNLFGPLKALAMSATLKTLNTPETLPALDVERCLATYDLTCVNQARSQVAQLGLHKTTLDATLGFAIAPRTKHGDMAICGLSGDGAIVLGMANGLRHIITCGYGNYCPWFMNFVDRRDIVERFAREEVHRRLVTTTTVGLDGYWMGSTSHYTSIETDPSNYWHIAMWPQKELRFIALLTDGYEQVSHITNTKRKAVDPIEVIDRATRFKNVFGDFVRRTNREIFELNQTDNRDDYTVVTLGIR